jgi:1-acyl-sn-glycerol-3-phosphate acyltransferase
MGGLYQKSGSRLLSYAGNSGVSPEDYLSLSPSGRSKAVVLDIIYAIILFAVKIGIKLNYKIHIEGMEHIPRKGPVVFLSNHTTLVDSFVIGCFVPRKIYFMTKSTEFESAGRRFFFYLSRTFPVRRYDIDPIALRNAMRIISYGGMVGIYPEGERTWDGRMQPFRRGTIRFLLAAGVPIIPAGISGAFENQPRWGGKIGKAPISLKVGEPILPPRIKGKYQTSEDIESLNAIIVERIEALKK